ncbi:MAG: hypothetical protein U1E42_14440 [Rhodospirillales bacterium]
MTIASLTAAADRLVTVLGEENAALAARDWSAVRRLSEAKRDAGAAWESAVAELAPANASLRAPISPSDKKTMAAINQRVEAAAEANERRLTVLMFAQRRVIETIAEAVASVGSAGSTYARTGAARSFARGGARPALSLNRSL